MLKINNFFLVIAFFTLSTLTLQAQKGEQFIDDLLSKMTLEEKIGQMNQYSSFFDPTGPVPQGTNNDKYDQIKKGLVGSMLNVKTTKDVRALQELAVENSRLGIPMIFGFDVIHGHKIMAPIPLGETASWDLAAIERSAKNAAMEASAVGINWTFAPMVDISRDARWGRVMEGAGEDTYLGSKVAAARIKGFQGDDLSSPNTIAACAKHFAGYGFAEGGRDYNRIDVSMPTLYNVILPPFKASVDAGVMTFMNGFQEMNGVPVTGNSFLQRDLLKGEWGFDGFIVSDWGSIGEMEKHGYAKDRKQSAYYAANAGSDMDMESNAYINDLKDLVESGKVDMVKIDDAVKRILTVKDELGLFEDPYRYCDADREKAMNNNQQLIDDVYDIARKSIVLLKNENNLLPLRNDYKKIALIGHLAEDKNSSLGNWRLGAEDDSAVSVLEALTSKLGDKVSFERGVELFNGQESFIQELSINMTDRSGISEAVELAKNSEVVVIVAGEHGYLSGEARSRTNIKIPGLQQEMIMAIKEVNPNIVLVVTNGRPLDLSWEDANIPAIVEAWQLGTMSGPAITDVLLGNYVPSGKLPVTFPRNVGQEPLYYNTTSTGRGDAKKEVFWSHYIDLEENTPLYPFGYGLSYTNFEYSALNVEKTTAGVKVSVMVKNTGKYEGEEVVQLYIKDHYASVIRPVKELKGFEKVMLRNGEEKKIEFLLTDEHLGFYNAQGKYIVEPGDFDVMVGGNSRDVLKASFILD